MPSRPAPAFAGILSLMYCAALPGAAHEDHARLRQLAEFHALELAQAVLPPGAEVRAEAGRLDPRLRLPPCPVMPEAFSTPGYRPGTHASIGLRCGSGPQWTLYVPVRVQVSGPVLVLARAAGRHEILTESHLRIEQRELGLLSGGYLGHPDAALGMSLRRPASPGTVLTTSLLQPPRLVRRGQQVRVVSGSGTVSVWSEGEALADAAAHQRVRVRTSPARTVVEGVVDAEGHIRVPD